MLMIAITLGIIATGSFIVGNFTAGMIAIGIFMSGCVILLFRVAGTGWYGQQGIMQNRSHIILDGTRHRTTI